MSKSVYFTDKFMLPEGKCSSDSELLSFRNELCSKFNRHIGLLLESKMPRKESSTKGRLNTRLAYRMPFNDNIFTKYRSTPSSDTTIALLIDGSGSMDCSTSITGLTRIQVCSAVASAFAKSINTVLNDQLKFEVFVKSMPDASESGDFGTKGSFPVLTRVFSNVKKNKDFDRLLSLTTYCPMSINGHQTGSYTAEYSVLPCFFNWAKDNLTTKNLVVFNLTDGETYASLGGDEEDRYSAFQFGNRNTRELALKYLRGVSNITLLLGNDVNEKRAKEIYGQNIIFSEGSDFVSPMFKTLTRIIDEAVE
jgi:hypothetical protein